MTLDEAKQLAEAVRKGQTRSYVRAAADLADFVLGLESVRPRFQRDDAALERPEAEPQTREAAAP